jgi:hypothetical protein
MMTRKTEVEQEKTRKSLHHQRQCRWYSDEKSGLVVGRTGAFGSVGGKRSKSAVYAAPRKVRKLEGVRCGCARVCVGTVHQKVLFADEQRSWLATEAEQDHPAAAHMDFHSHVAGL